MTQLDPTSQQSQPTPVDREINEDASLHNISHDQQPELLKLDLITLEIKAQLSLS